MKMFIIYFIIHFALLSVQRCVYSYKEKRYGISFIRLYIIFIYTFFSSSQNLNKIQKRNQEDQRMSLGQIIYKDGLQLQIRNLYVRQFSIIENKPMPYSDIYIQNCIFLFIRDRIIRNADQIFIYFPKKRRLQASRFCFVNYEYIFRALYRQEGNM